jgi:hypothetical protein
MCPVAHSCSAATHQQHQHTAQHPHVSADGAALRSHATQRQWMCAPATRSHTAACHAGSRRWGTFLQQVQTHLLTVTVALRERETLHGEEEAYW